MTLFRLTTLAAALLGTVAFADSRHSSHHGSGGSGSPPACIKWANVPADAGFDAGVAAPGDEVDEPLDGGEVPAPDAGPVATVRVCVEHAPTFGCSASGNASGLAPFAIGFAALLLRRRRLERSVVMP